jgi:hypothetical protein
MDLEGPIVIGGIGGSGTRVVAQILKEMNFFIGYDLNEPLDNLTYTLLFKRKKWFYKNFENRKKIFRGLGIMEKSMLNPSPEFSISDYHFLLNATISMFKNGHNIDGDGKGSWAIERFKKVINGRENESQKYTGWGWKEPNSHLLLPYLNEYFPEFKYIHTIRNGLDMAFSSNQQQLFNWGPMFGVYPPKREVDIPEASFRYWVEANKKVIKMGNEMGSDKFYLLNFENICTDVDAGINMLLKFLKIEPNNETYNSILNIPKLPSTSGRFRENEINWLKDDDSNFLQLIGF